MRSGRGFPIRPLIERTREAPPPVISTAPSVGASNATVLVTAPTGIPLDTPSGVSSASLTLGTGGTQVVVLNAATGLSDASLALTAPTRIILYPSVGFSRTMLNLETRVIVFTRASESQVVSVTGEDFEIDHVRALDADA